MTENKTKYNFYNCLLLLSECVKHGIIQNDPEDKDSVLVYWDAEQDDSTNWYEPNQSGWRSINIFTAAQQLLTDGEGQEMLEKALSEKGVTFHPENIPDCP